ncbi:MAG: 16S rRNA (uracil(1498)-N(3))-methyltransferase [Sulfurimonas sp.]|uniref:16S rRNA (uracil(1498)-N(3))-methyltransferase n=1 Tax=Sulfurimonas sp. TaxID=2022749 RepID=UPI002609773C|nr:16S rRNA (uracil(1498)-N(3))-methyltransferase [Sulfurimonas sp.]MDD3475442.1 16S rRNA (uracil(1498)-N(3))-methyltransferase [Sulfurimonas sp.]
MDLIYILDDEAGKETLHVRAELYKYLIKVRRHKEGDILHFRARVDLRPLHTYKLESLEPRSAELTLISSEIKEVKSSKNLHIGWCTIDSNAIEKVLPSLCEIGVQRITFISCERSQKNFKLDFKRFERLLEASMQQSGRSNYIEFDTCKSVKEFIAKHPDTKVFDFCDNTLADYSDISTVLIGCEGGFSPNEREIFKSLGSFRLDTPMVLRSESATLAVASKILL